jgi:hypothetical protein
MAERVRGKTARCGKENEGTTVYRDIVREGTGVEMLDEHQEERRRPKDGGGGAEDEVTRRLHSALHGCTLRIGLHTRASYDVLYINDDSRPFADWNVSVFLI